MKPDRTLTRTVSFITNPIWIFALPLLLGVLYLAGTSTHGDECMYRLMPRVILDHGILPLVPFEWGHPGHFALVACLVRIQEVLGGGGDPMLMTQFLNFLLHAWLAWSVYRVFDELSPEGRRAPAFLAGIAVATIPGWLWVSQMALSDVSGNALALLVAARLVMHELVLSRGSEEPSPPTFLQCLSLSLTGLLLSFSVLVRVSSFAYFPLFCWLSLRVLFAIRSGRLRAVLAYVFGGLLPQVAFYGYMISTYGFRRFYDRYSTPIGDNSSFLADLPTLSSRWWSHYENGLGPVQLWLGMIGILLGVLLVFHRGSFRPFRSRRWLSLGFVALILPYLVAVARNQAWYEFRYQVPALFAISLGVGILGLLLARRLPDPVLYLATILILGFNLGQSKPMLTILGEREAFIESGVRRLVRLTPRKTAVPGHYAHPFTDVFGDGRMAIPVHGSLENKDTHHTFLTFEQAEASMLVALDEGNEVRYVNEQGLDQFRRWLVKQGWKEETVYTRPFDAGSPDMRGLRNWDDFMVSDMSTARALLPSPLEILRPVPPEHKRAPLVATASLNEQGNLEIEVQALEALGGRRCRLLFASNLAPENTSLSNRCKVPFSKDDDLFVQSSQPDASQNPILRPLLGKVSVSGKVRFVIPKVHLPTIRNAWFTVIFHREGVPFYEGRLRTPVRRVSDLLASDPGSSQPRKETGSIKKTDEREAETVHKKN